MISSYSFSLSAILLFCFAVPVTVADMEPVESQAPLGHSMLGALPQRTIDHAVFPNADRQFFGVPPPMVFKRADNTVAPLDEGTVDRPVSGDISEMSIQDNQSKLLRRRWYPYGGYGGYGYYPYYPYGGGGLDLELGLGLGLHL
ncbi:hypothetical protein GGI03_007788 [Coemansia sp. RSA 2337]|nr:hypothetical protein GGI08_007919 [Coemansia sp. S2]KAJ2042742.1 hypothetical protein H4S04_007132 [Coemansia sp. S16]KAJ2049468.1 hypothetical protein GGH13_008910 [Coemansia sp. S155-1]KAJ2335582.1 hypothetical protein GGH92_007989 [Coemansia sp. RSA 2673]KAJ2444716.1 hypothetical protein GGI03_007788 [Coemansia sp. RSA 2337]